MCNPNVDNNFQVIIEQLAQEANKSCGLVYELFVERFTNSVDIFLSSLSLNEKEKALTIAQRYGYSASVDDDIDDSDCTVCCHGIDIDCCPAGCADAQGDFIDDNLYETDNFSFNAANIIFDELTELCIQATQHKLISPVKWCELKLYIVENEQAIDWFETLYIDVDIDPEFVRINYSELVKYLQKKIINSKNS
ncbi:hypothetical protein [Photobacterium damselae]|uniref:Uncharacterized protein n=1 Tax=Photobacterium damselae subsp. damselae TaxID=85581 RepID=A0AAD3WUR7_PHODD|nr:hypothetical protein [Photobacterium damselae]KAB1179928.1 hypothetical protein F6450_12145 [Photobacterium damselae subsp. damselae]